MGTVPFSNPAGNNQTNPVSSMIPKASPVMPGSKVGGVGIAQTNPYVPPSTGAVPSTGSASTSGATVPNVGGLTVDPSNSYGTTGGLDKQLKDIWGKGVGGALGKLLEGMSGTDSQILQDYIKSLQPQMATAQADVNAALGKGGVSANSSVTAIADSNLQAQEQAAIAGESAKLTQSQEMLTAEILTGMQGAAQKEVATSGWSIFGDVMNQITGDIGNLAGGDYSNANSKGLAGNTPGPNMSPQQLNFGGVPGSPSLTSADVSAMFPGS
jgi:hypothetical protein